MRVPKPIKRPLVWALNRTRDLRNSRRRTVEKVALSNDRAAFEKIYGSDSLRREYLGPERLAFYDAVADRCADFEPRNVIDVGCGTGSFLVALARRCPTIERIVGVDQAAAGIKQLRRAIPRAEGVIGDIHQLDLSGQTFDLVVCLEVLEHLDHPQRVLVALERLCATGGRLVVTVPDGDVDTYAGHLHFWSADGFEALLSAVGEPSVSRVDTALLGIVDPRSGRAR